MTKHSIAYFKHPACSRSPHHDLTPIEIQRWEDNGRAVLPEAPLRHRHEQLDHDTADLAAE